MNIRWVILLNYIKRSKTVKAWQFKGNFEEAPEWVLEELDNHIILNIENTENQYFIVGEEDEKQILFSNDYIIKYDKDILFKMDETLFNAMYMSVEELSKIEDDSIE